jgi:Uma2 family endonuclease
MLVPTIEEFLREHDTKPASEYACGEAFQKPLPNRHHSKIQGFFYVVLGEFLNRTALGDVFLELHCTFGPHGRQRIFVPDLCYVARERLGDDQYLRSAPDLAIEVLSPDQHRTYFLDKIQFYLLNGVRLVWVVDPATATITVQAPGQEGRILRAGDVLDGGDVLPGFSVAVDDIFAQTRI